MNIFSERLKGILDSRGISQVWVAEKANATAATISRYMTTDRVPRGDIVASISKALNVSRRRFPAEKARSTARRCGCSVTASRRPANPTKR